MRTPGILLIIVSVFFGGCAGRDPRPVSCYIPGDEKLDCESLRQQVSRLQTDMLALLPKTDKTLINTLWAVGGAVVTVPYVFMDMKEAERIEYEALRRRHNRLLLIAEDRGCNMKGIRAEAIPALWQKESKEKSADEETLDG